MKTLLSLIVIPFKIIFRIPQFIINAVIPYKKIYNKTLSYYKDYQNFMNIADMPEYRLKYNRFSPKDLATECYKSGKYEIGLNNGCNKYNLRATIYHEFTHIYDDEWFKKKHKISGFLLYDAKKKWVYKEVHAEQIRTLYMLGCDNINVIPEITYDKILRGIGITKITFHKYCVNHKSVLVSYSNLFKTLSKNRRIKITEKFLWGYVDSIIYYIGIASIYKKYCTYDIDNIMDLSDVSELLGEGINRLLDIYCNGNSLEDISKDEIIESGEIRKDIIDFVKYKLRIVR